MATMAGSASGYWRRAREKRDVDGGATYQRAMSRMFKESSQSRIISVVSLIRLGENRNRTMHLLTYPDGSVVLFSDDGYGEDTCKVLRGPELDRYLTAMYGGGVKPAGAML